jgi:hypothetical protein
LILRFLFQLGYLPVAICGLLCARLSANAFSEWSVGHTFCQKERQLREREKEMAMKREP